jgi:quercetin dioxygenase-like cupin family protein
MKIKQKLISLMLIGIFGLGLQVHAQMNNMPEDHIMVMPGDIKWVDGPPSLPPGTKVAILEGDPGKAGLFTMRVKIPANWKVMPHTHPADEHITVIEGSGYMGMGEKYDEKTAKEMVTGAFAVMKTGTAHYFFTKKECIIQTHGMGPWGITYVNPADDPRNNIIKK